MFSLQVVSQSVSRGRVPELAPHCRALQRRRGYNVGVSTRSIEKPSCATPVRRTTRRRSNFKKVIKNGYPTGQSRPLNTRFSSLKQSDGEQNKSTLLDPFMYKILFVEKSFNYKIHFNKRPSNALTAYD